VTVGVDAKADTVTVRVLDDGPGIPAESRSRVFEPFFRASADTEGTGLGLAIVREIADAHHGAITLKPGEGGKGVHISVSFPRAAAEQPQAV
jgi:two-component system sensor histidine kinase TctE